MSHHSRTSDLTSPSAPPAPVSADEEDLGTPTSDKLDASKDRGAVDGRTPPGSNLQRPPQVKHSSAGTHPGEGEEEQDEQEKPKRAPPDFAPFYTLIADPIAGTHAHPTVHYLFADDDPDILTTALLASVKDEFTSAACERHDLAANPRLEPSPASGEVEERFVIIDMSDDGKQIVSATSLARDWQSLKASITAAPSWRGGDGNDDDTVTNGLMLKISGQEASNGINTRSRPQSDLDVLMQTFDQGLADLAGVLDE